MLVSGLSRRERMKIAATWCRSKNNKQNDDDSQKRTENVNKVFHSEESKPTTSDPKRMLLCV